MGSAYPSGHGIYNVNLGEVKTHTQKIVFNEVQPWQIRSIVLWVNTYTLGWKIVILPNYMFQKTNQFIMFDCLFVYTLYIPI